MKLKKKRWGVSLSVLVSLLFGLWWGVPTYRKAKADAMVRELCAKDGDIKVYEIIIWPKEKFDSYGNVKFSGNKNLPPSEKEVRPTEEFYFTWDTTWIIPETSFGSLAVWRDHQKLFRAVDHKLLGEAIGYSRRGGDPIGPWHPSHFGCPVNADITTVVRQIFVKQ